MYIFLAILAIVAIVFFWIRMKKTKKEKMTIEEAYHYDVVDKAMGGSGVLTDAIDQS